MNLKYLFTYYRTKSSYAYWLGFQLLIILALVVDSVLHYEDHAKQIWTITKVEAIITCIFAMEVSIRIYLARGQFFFSLWNILDVTNLLIIVLIICFSYVLSWNNSLLMYS